MSPWEGAESRCVPRARTSAWISTGEPFEGKGASGVAVVLDPNPQAVGVFFCLLSAVALVRVSARKLAPLQARWPEGPPTQRCARRCRDWACRFLAPSCPGRNAAVCLCVLLEIPRVVPCAMLLMLPIGAEPPGRCWCLGGNEERIW